MRYTVKLPRLGDTSDDVVVVQCYRKIGDSIQAGEPLFRVETNKVEVDVEAPVSGLVRELLVQDGDEVSVGTPIAVLEDS